LLPPGVVLGSFVGLTNTWPTITLHTNPGNNNCVSFVGLFTSDTSRNSTLCLNGIVELHQICWAHLHRNARDITHLECLSEAKLAHVKKFYEELSVVYASIRQYQEEPFNEVRRQKQARALLEQVKQLCMPHKLDPKKLVDLKAGILEYQDCLFLCLTIDGIPADNNKAERALRKLVIKRKKSFGVKTLKGARTMEVLRSVCQSLYNQDQNNFLPELHKLALET
jgi:hypothetical protein